MEPPIIAAIITASVTLISVALAAGTLWLQLAKDRRARVSATQDRLENISRSDHQRAEDADRRERTKAYSDFLVAESARSDAFDHYATIKNEARQTPFKQGTPDEAARQEDIMRRLAAASAEIDRTRQEAWGPLSAMRLVAPDEVIRAADAYDRELAASNPRRIKVPPVPLRFGRKKELIEAFVAAARRDLGRGAVQADVLVSVEDSNETAP
jgi:hypothetical protein